MKQYLSTAFGLFCGVLAPSLIVLKRSDDARHERDAGTITDYSNQLDSARTETAIYKGKTLALSNRLDENRTAALTLSNHLRAMDFSLACDAAQITNRTRHVAEMEAENQTLNRRETDLANLAGLDVEVKADGTFHVISPADN
jgi:hypothetical protein